MGKLYAFRKTRSEPPPAREKRRSSGQFRVTDRRASSDRSDERCNTSGYAPRMEGGRTDHARNISPSLRGCYADPVEVALEEHTERLPKHIDHPGSFTTKHRYNHDPAAWPRELAVTTVCRDRKLRTFIHRPDEGLVVFGL